jgi:NAD(P)-dependent dehydrogenase (short-subunit alcohol dehydrogenase family)
MADLADRVALVTGGSSGIGRAVAVRLAGDGAAVVAFSDHRADLDALAADRDVAGSQLAIVAGDVTRPGDLAAAVQLAEDRFGGLDVLVNAAGVFLNGSVDEITDEGWARVLSVNLTGAFAAARAAIPAMRRRGGGAVVNIVSSSAYAVRPRMAAYAASKGGLLALTRAMAIDHARENIRVNAVCPGPVDTPMLRRAWESFGPDFDVNAQLRRIGGAMPIGRIGEADEVAEVVAFLASDRASLITGADIKADGGMLSLAAVPPPSTEPADHPREEAA